jgi:outer membrane protein OmpA-like peptidoglycan-associated protein
VTERRTRSQWIRRRELRDPDGRRRVVRSRRYWVRDRRNRNRFRRGRSIYYLPPAGAALALGAYLVSSANAGYDTYLDTFLAPPVVDVDRRYTLEEVIEDPEVRSKVRSVNLDTVNFAFGSSELADAELGRLEEMADAMLAVIEKRPDELFLIAGHTDAVGSEESNLALSEARAAAVHEALVVEYGVPPENLESVGYGEQYLLVNTQGSSRANRRVTVRAIGALLTQR